KSFKRWITSRRVMDPSPCCRLTIQYPARFDEERSSGRAWRIQPPGLFADSRIPSRGGRVLLRGSVPRGTSTRKAGTVDETSPSAYHGNILRRDLTQIAQPMGRVLRLTARPAHRSAMR